jgi:uncharacterized membrane protein
MLIRVPVRPDRYNIPQMTLLSEPATGLPPTHLFSALLTPHRSLNHTGFWLLMGLLTAISFAVSLGFWLMGAWPVTGFFGLDLLAVYWAFKINFGGAKACEEILVTPSELRVRRVSPRGQVAEWVLNPLWVKLDQKHDAEFGVQKLYLVTGGSRLPIASFLAPNEKASFARALTQALQNARRGYDPAL